MSINDIGHNTPSEQGLDYVEMTDNRNEQAKGQKFMLPISLSNDLDWLAEQHGCSKTDIARAALNGYFSQNHYWNNKRYFVEPKNKYEIDESLLSNMSTTTTVHIMWTNQKDDPAEKYAFVSCRVLDIKEKSLVVNPMFYLPLTTAKGDMLIKKSDRVTPGFIDFDPNVYSAAPFLYNLKYEVEFKYIWDVYI